MRNIIVIFGCLLIPVICIGQNKKTGKEKTPILPIIKTDTFNSKTKGISFGNGWNWNEEQTLILFYETDNLLVIENSQGEKRFIFLELSFEEKNYEIIVEKHFKSLDNSILVLIKYWDTGDWKKIKKVSLQDNKKEFYRISYL